MIWTWPPAIRLLAYLESGKTRTQDNEVAKLYFDLMFESYDLDYKDEMIKLLHRKVDNTIQTDKMIKYAGNGLQINDGRFKKIPNVKVGWPIDFNRAYNVSICGNWFGNEKVSFIRRIINKIAELIHAA
jgi:hypothetical protein